jgi:isopenicillin N synthase-like dioxygenase
MPTSELPALRFDDPVEQRGEALRQAAVSFGAVAVDGLDRLIEKADAATDAAAEFFDADASVKELSRCPPDQLARGWNSYTDDEGRPTFERLSFGQFDDAHQAAAAGVPEEYLDLFAAPNIWPAGRLRSLVEDYRDAAAQLCADVLSEIAVAFGYPGDAFTADRADHTNTALTRYFPGGKQPDGPIGPDTGADLGYAVHRDATFATALTERGEPECLLIQNLLDGTWHAVNAKPGAMIVIFGTALERRTGKAIRAARHLVLSPRREPRYSTGVFYNAALTTSVLPDGVQPGATDATGAPAVTTIGDLYHRFISSALR